ncbi:hypothetical protein F2Q70_00038221 [Brassica cretica]|uniref:Uncharacterized protein n=1 Tax=Brassica cretica TaxID=69181 RepID=A0A8S9K9J1_BRACR|nr:hypothetical protein F2Q70_00038221 [Brassica cretica]
MIKFRYCPELVQFHGFRSVEVLLDTPPRCSKSCPEAKGRSVRVQISLSRPVSVYMVKLRFCQSRDQFSPVQSSRPLGFGKVSSDQPAAYRQRTFINHILADSICATHNARHIGVALGKDDQIAWCWTSWSKLYDSDRIVPNPSRSASGPWCWVGRLLVSIAIRLLLIFVELVDYCGGSSRPNPNPKRRGETDSENWTVVWTGQMGGNKTSLGNDFISIWGKEIKKDLRNLDKFVSWGIRVLWQSNSHGVKFVTLTGSSLARHVALPDHGVGLDGQSCSCLIVGWPVGLSSPTLGVGRPSVMFLFDCWPVGQPMLRTGRSSGKSPMISIHYSDGEDISGERQHLVSLSPGSKDETVAATRKRRQSSEGALPGPSRPRFVPEGDGSLCAAQSDLISLAGRMRYAVSVSHLLLPRPRRKPTTRLRWRVRSLNEYVVVMKDQVVASRNDKEIESIGSEIKRLSKELEATKREWKKDTEKIEALTEDWRRIHLENEALTTQMVAQKVRITALEVERDRDICRASRVARRAIATRYREILESLKDKWARKKKEVCAEIQLQEVVANIDLLNELKDGGLTVDTELARLKEMEGDCEALVASFTVSDWSVSELDLPQVSDDSADQVGGSYVPVDSASS